MSDAIHLKTAHQLREAIRAKEVSAREAAQAYLDQINAVDGDIHAYTHVWHDAALTRADAIDEMIARGDDPGPFTGVPIGLKDLICTTEGTTACCSELLKGFQSPYDATVAEKLNNAGAVVLGKLNMDEFAMGSSTENSSVVTTRNPWNLECVPGGSSGGSAAAVSAFECAMAIGSDTGGSIRQPAACCGCVGMKPTYGRVSRYGLVAFASSLDQIGPFTRDVRDCALTLNTICGHDRRDSTSADLEVPDFLASLTGGAKGIRIGLPKEYYTDALGPETRSKINDAVKVLEENGAEVVEVSLPHTEYAVATYYIICTAEASANLARFDGVRYGNRAPDVKSPEELYKKTKSAGFGPEVQRRILLGTYVLSSGYYDAYYLKAQKVRTLIKQDFDAAFEQCDVIVTPTAPTPAFKIGEKSDDPLSMYLSDIYTISVNLAGLPGVSLPCGLTESGLPVGLQVFGRPFDEATVLQAAYAYEQNSGLDLGHADRHRRSRNVKYEPVIGMEVHVELSTRSKVFCECDNNFHAPPNTNVCPVCLGMPGVLPVLNQRAVEFSVLVGLALNCTISRWSKMDRKNYFYPDLAKNYQISQYDLPLCHDGYLDVHVNGETKRIGITRAHLEEDTARNTHTIGGGESGVDFNRCGVPLLEIVTEPDIRSADEAYAYLTSLRQILRVLGRERLQHGRRVAPRRGEHQHPPRRNRTIRHEDRGQKRRVVHGNAKSHRIRDQAPSQSPRRRRRDSPGNPRLGRRQRHHGQPTVQGIRARLPVFPGTGPRADRGRRSLGNAAPRRHARIAAGASGKVCRDPRLIGIRRGRVDRRQSRGGLLRSHGRGQRTAKQAANWIMGDLQALLTENQKTIGDVAMTPAQLAEMIGLIEDGTISGKIAKELLPEMSKTGTSPGELVKAKGLAQISDTSELEQIAAELIAANPGPAEDFRNGKDKALGFFVGQMMKATKGQANPKMANEIMKKLLQG
jgi:aspartyl-tRNA(Asn)/glutamyl-tRNA(Gln) amidotransferase subunit A